MNSPPNRQLLWRFSLLGILLLGWSLLLIQLNTIPPGLQHDETFNIFDVIELLHKRYHIYFPANYGREPLFFYSVAAVYRFIGLHFVWGLRFAGVLWAMIGLAFSVVLAKRYLRLPYVALAGVLLVTSFWFIFAARVGLRAVSLFPLATGAFYFLLRGFEKRSTRDFVALGILTGLTVYSYLPGRFISPIVILILLFEFGVMRLTREKYPVRLGQLGIAIFSIVLVSMPLYYYIYMHPDLANQRINELSGPLDALSKADIRPFLNTAWETIKTLLWENQDAIDFHYSLPQRPVLLPLLSLLFLTGIIAAIAGLRHRKYRLLFVWLLVGLFPNMVTGGGPLFLRAIIALPIIFIVIALGASLFEKLLLRLPRHRIRQGAQLLFFGILVIGAIWHAVYNTRGYYNDWARSDETQVIYRSDLRRIASYLNTLTLDTPTFISSSFWLDLDQQTYLLYEPKKRNVGWFNAYLGMPLPSDREILYVFSASSRPTPSLRCILDQTEQMDVGMTPSGNTTLFESYKMEPWDADNLPCQLRPTTYPLVFGDSLRLDSAAIRTVDGETTVLTQWTVLAPWPHAAPPKLSVRLRDDTGSTIAQVDDALAVAYQHWQPGDKFLQTTQLSTAATLPQKRDLFVVIYSAQGAVPATVNGENVGEEAPVMLQQ